MVNLQSMTLIILENFKMTKDQAKVDLVLTMEIISKEFGKMMNSKGMVNFINVLLRVS